VRSPEYQGRTSRATTTARRSRAGIDWATEIPSRPVEFLDERATMTDALAREKRAELVTADGNPAKAWQAVQRA
jgi:hypothetical protein